MDHNLQDQRIQELVAKNEQELLVILGEELTQDRAGALPLTPKQLADRGRKWFAAFILEIRPQLCGNPAIRAVGEKADSVALGIAIIDLIARHLEVVSPATVAALIVQIGVNQICGDFWKQD